jgi:hypothetical protein
MDTGIQSQTVGSETTAVHPDLNGRVSNGDYKVYKFFDFITMQPNNNTVSSCSSLNLKLEIWFGRTHQLKPNNNTNLIRRKEDKFIAVPGLCYR